MKKKEAKELRGKLDLACDELKRMSSDIYEMSDGFRLRRTHTPEDVDKVILLSVISGRLLDLASKVSSAAKDLKDLEIN